MKRILGLAGLLMLFAACEQFGIDTKETIMPGPVRDDVKVYASIEQPASPETKVYADDSLKVLWHADDTISFFNKLTLNDKWRFTGETGDNGGFFEQIAAQVGTGNEITYYCAVYPYQSTTRISNDDVLTVTLPAVQKYADGSFGPGANTMVAVAPTSIFSFKNVCGYLSFKLYGKGISVSSITLKGNDAEPLAGKGTIPMAVDSLPKITMSDVATKEITLVCDPPVALGSSAADFTEFWMVVPPTVFESGFTVTIKAKNGMTIRKSLSNSLEIERSKIKRMAPLEVVLPVPEAVDLGLPSGLKWATFNIGAGAPEEYGDYFAWGETEPKDDYSWATYKFELGTGQRGPFSKYVANSLFGTVDNKVILDLEDDTANVNWGDNWRIPTKQDWDEIREGCIWLWTTENGVNGCKVTSTTNGNSIFLPAAGSCYGTDLNSAGTTGYYLSSQLYPSDYCNVWQFRFGAMSNSWSGNLRCLGQSVRPVYAPNHVASVSLDKADMTLFAGDSTTLIATLAPSAVLIPSVSWSSSDNSIATVDYSGKVKAVSPGNATITVTTTDGGKTASCNVTVAAQPEAVDLGLPSGLKWASFNVGASTPEESGDYFAWGETEPKEDYSWATYKWSNGDGSILTKYNTLDLYGTVDNKTTIDPEDDAAHVHWGGKWRMPTKAEIDELINNCSAVWTKENGVNGCRFTSRKAGYEGKSVFFPAAGGIWNQSSDLIGSRCIYRSSSLDGDSPSSAICLFSYQGNTYWNGFGRWVGAPVRPVYYDPPLKAVWYFDTDPAKDTYTETFGTTAGTFKDTAGDNGMYIDANGKGVGTGRITFVQVDKTSFGGENNPRYYVGGTGHPYMTGVWPGDYWLFTATDGKEYPAGTKLHIKYLTRISGTGQKYWKLEYWDGAAWQPATELQTETETETGTSAQYNFIELTSNTTVEETFALAAPCTQMQFRMVCVANWQSNGHGALAAPNGGTCRLAAVAEDLEGTSPVFEVVK